MKTLQQKIGAVLDSRLFFLTIATTGVIVGSSRLLSGGGEHSSSSAEPHSNAPDAGRGEYLVRHAGVCADCHSPRDARGEFIPELWLKGGPIAFTPTVEMPVWADVALPIAGLPTIPTDAEAVKFLMVGKRADGRTPRPPMPEYRFNREDATDVVAYLRSLKTGGPSGEQTAKR